MASKKKTTRTKSYVRDYTDKYTYRIQWHEEDREFVGLCAEFPLLSWLAPGPEAALKGIRKVVSDVVADKLDRGESVPEPLMTRRFSGVFKVRIPSEVHRRLVVEAAESNVSLNRLVSSKLSSQTIGGMEEKIE